MIRWDVQCSGGMDSDSGGMDSAQVGCAVLRWDGQ